MNTAILRVSNLRVYYDTLAGPVKAVDGVSFDLMNGERFGLVGESGSGKSTLAHALLLLIKPPGRIMDGQILLSDQNLLNLSREEIRRLRLKTIALIPQESMNSLNPVERIKDQILDGVADHSRKLSGKEARDFIRELLDRVQLKPEVADLFPHELSGGMKQRICLAIAISLRPSIIIADEPTSALDVVVQRQVMIALGRMQESMGVSVLLVGHDMGLMAQFADRLGVMYAGKLVELDTVANMFKNALHPYTQLLIECPPTLQEKREFKGIPGIPPQLLNPPSGCIFHSRCPKVKKRCLTEVPNLKEIYPGRWVACHLYSEEKI
ncbi:MAG: ABC transporter ATP-binding protein [Spirochaetia bacterium]